MKKLKKQYRMSDYEDNFFLDFLLPKMTIVIFALFLLILASALFCGGKEVVAYSEEKKSLRNEVFDLKANHERQLLFFGDYLEEKLQDFPSLELRDFYHGAKNIQEYVAQRENQYLYDMEGNPIICAYYDNGVYSIGYGSVARAEDECISKQQAWERFNHVFNIVLAQTKQEFPHWDKHEVDAMSSLVFNVKKKHSDEVKRRFHIGDDIGAIYYWESLTMKGTIYEPGLSKRRPEEIAMFLNQII